MSFQNIIQVLTVYAFVRGHGTYVEDGNIKSSVVGVVKQINKLVSVIPMKSKYTGETELSQGSTNTQ